MWLNTAVISKNGTSTTIRFMNAVMLSSTAGCFLRLRRRLLAILLLCGVLELGQVIGEANRRHLQAVDDFGCLGLQQGIEHQ